MNECLMSATNIPTSSQLDDDLIILLAIYNTIAFLSPQLRTAALSLTQLPPFRVPPFQYCCHPPFLLPSPLSNELLTSGPSCAVLLTAPNFNKINKYIY